MIILYKSYFTPYRLHKGFLVETFEEKTSVITEYFRFKN
ncbi:hypothetical protein BN129_1803 [Cronobacter sakazakii 701]|nr:hypothetical protein BN129_1803 [Cronobacter sakazakii 701]